MTDDRDDAFDTTLDRRLRHAGAAWRATGDPGIALDARSATHRTHARVVPTVLATVACVILLAVLAAVLHNAPERAVGPTGPSPSTTIGNGVVPWADLPPTHPTLLRKTIPASPDPAAAADLPPCTIDHVRFSAVTLGAAAGTYYFAVRMAHADGPACRAYGHPAVRLLANGEPLEIPVENSDPELDGGPFEVVGPVRVDAAHTAGATLAWVTSRCPSVRADALEIRLADTGEARRVPFTVGASCDPSLGSSNPVIVGPFQPTIRSKARVVSPYDGVRASGQHQLTAEPGGTLSFEVTLTSPRDLVLDPCPDYTINTAAGLQRHALNCGAVPFRTADGQPYLPAHTEVVFAMRAPAGDRSTEKFMWQLVESGHPPTSYRGVLVVGDDVPDGSIEGMVMLEGGRSPGTSTKVIRGEVTALRDDGTVVTAAIENARYDIQLPPGRWTLTATSPDYLAGKGTCHAAGPVTVQPGRGAMANLSCPTR